MRESIKGSLCAQHCLNNLLQGEYFSPVELSFIAQQLDEEERMRMAEGGMSSEEYRTFLQVTVFITLVDHFKPAWFCV
uniref:ubiquitinyl hydrolase 1 n=1 Tax=Crocodylus porosus TaxID=8502 RepID=A0A7M4EMU6_CROPO